MRHLKSITEKEKETEFEIKPAGNQTGQTENPKKAASTVRTHKKDDGRKINKGSLRRRKAKTEAVYQTS